MKRPDQWNDGLLNDFQQFQLDDYVSKLNKPENIIHNDQTKDRLHWQSNIGLIKFMSTLHNFRKKSHKHTLTVATETSVGQQLALPNDSTNIQTKSFYKKQQKNNTKTLNLKQTNPCSRKISHIQLSFPKVSRSFKSNIHKSQLRSPVIQPPIGTSILTISQNVPSHLLKNIDNHSNQFKTSEEPKRKQSRIRASIYRFLLRSRRESVGTDNLARKKILTEQSHSSESRTPTVELDSTFKNKKPYQIRGFLSYKSRLANASFSINQR